MGLIYLVYLREVYNIIIIKIDRNLNVFINLKSLELEVPIVCLVIGCVLGRRDRRYLLSVSLFDGSNFYGDITWFDVEKSLLDFLLEMFSNRTRCRTEGSRDMDRDAY